MSDEDFNVEKLINDLMNSTFDIDLDMFLYQHFDREKLLSTAFQRGKAKGYTEEKINRDLLKLGFLASFKSENYINIYRSRSSAEKKWLSEVKEVYNLKVKPCKAPNCLTLRHLAETYARELSLQLHKKTILPCIEPDTLAPGFPVAMCLSSFACLLPTNLVKNESKIFMRAFCYFRLHFDKYAYPQPQQRFTKQEIQNYVERRSRNLPYLTKEKEEHLLKVGLIVMTDDDKYMINPAIKPALEEASQKWEAL